VTTYQLAVPGARLQIESVGSPSAPPLLLLHGGPGAGASYLRPQCDRLASGPSPCRLIYFDQRGCEHSPLDPGVGPGGYRQLVDDVEAIRAWLGVPQLRLAGYSWGGLLALLYALAHPQRLAQLVLISPAPASAAGRALFRQRLLDAAKRPAVSALRQQLLPPGATLHPETAKRYRFALAVAGYFVDPKRALELSPFLISQRVEQAVWTSLGDYDLRPQLPSLRPLPTLVIHGAEDPIPVQSAEETAALLNARLHILPGCGHVPYIEAADELFATIADFLGHHAS
jgi:proline iminopeptidase